MKDIPKRIQRKRTAGWKMPENTIYVGRPSKWGNPFEIGGSILDIPYVVLKHTPMSEQEIEAGIITQALAVRFYQTWLIRHTYGCEIADLAKKQLQGKNLACWCKEGEPCHADILLEIANPTK